MSTWIEIEHQLHFSYEDYVRESRMELRIEPRNLKHQTLRSFVIAVGPPSRVHRYTDWNGNRVHHFGIHDFHQRIEVMARSLVITHPDYPPLEGLASPGAVTGDLFDWTRFDGPVARSARLEELASEVAVDTDAPLGRQIETLGRFVLDRFRYVPNVTDYRSTTHDLLESGAGVCQDFAHLMLALLRLRGIPCRYVNGYFHVAREGAAQSHAWVEVWADGDGWVGYDPTHGQVPDERYVVVAYGRHYDDVPPNRGIFRGNARETLHAEVRTSIVEPRELSEIHEQIAQIEVPVLRELPAHRSLELAEPPPQQQQQQQQQ